MKNKITFGHCAALITIIIWGTTFISTKVLLNILSPIEILFIRFLIGYIILWSIYPHHLHLTHKKEELYFMAAGLCGVTLYYLFENIALTYTLASNVGVIISIAPFFTVIFACLFLHEEKPHIRFFIGFIIAMMGIYLISFSGSQLQDPGNKRDSIGQCMQMMYEYHYYVSYIEFYGCDHFSWYPAFNYPDFMDWLFNQKK